MMKKFIIQFVIFLLLLTGIGLYRLNELNKIPIKVENFSTYNLVEIYVLGIVMSVLGYPLYPEVAVEHLSLLSQEKGERQSDFFMESKVVQRAIKNYEKPTLLAWDNSAYMIGHPEARVALALNGATLFKDGQKYPLKCLSNIRVMLLRLCCQVSKFKRGYSGCYKKRVGITLV